jgi:hypothetical protein
MFQHFGAPSRQGTKSSFPNFRAKPRPWSGTARSTANRRGKNIDHAVEVAKRRYERICHVPIWSLYADRLELESKGQRILYRPTHDEIALTRIPGRDKGVGRNARRGLYY